MQYLWDLQNTVGEIFIKYASKELLEVPHRQEEQTQPTAATILKTFHAHNLKVADSLNLIRLEAVKDMHWPDSSTVELQLTIVF